MFRSEYVYVYGCLRDVTVMLKSDFSLHPVARPVDRIVKSDFKTGEILMKSDIGLQPVAGPVGRKEQIWTLFKSFKKSQFIRT